MNDTIKQTINEFDGDFSRVCFNQGKIYATSGFHLGMFNNWTFDVKQHVKYNRLIKYRSKGLTITVDDEKYYNDESKNKKIIKMNNNKWYTWTIESVDRLNYLITLLFDKDYEPTVLPLYRSRDTWILDSRS